MGYNSANFAGHIHNYERFQVDGIPYFIVGTGGGPCEDLNTTDPYPVWYQFGMTKRLGYLKVTVDPANNAANAQEIFVGQVKEDNDNETPKIYNPQIIADTITFPLKSHSSTRKSETQDILIKNQTAVSWGSATAVNNVHLESTA